MSSTKERKNACFKTAVFVAGLLKLFCMNPVYLSIAKDNCILML